MFNELSQKIQKTNEQRIKMMFTIINVINNSKESTLELRTAVAASMLDMLDTSMLPEDKAMVDMLNDSIDSLAKEVEEFGVFNLKDNLRSIIKSAHEKIDRITSGDSILNNINLN